MAEEYYTRKELDEHVQMGREEGFAAGLEHAAFLAETVHQRGYTAEMIREEIPKTSELVKAKTDW